VAADEAAQQVEPMAAGGLYRSTFEKGFDVLGQRQRRRVAGGGIGAHGAVDDAVQIAAQTRRFGAPRPGGARQCGR